MIDRILTNGIVIHRISEAVPKSEAPNHHYPGTELSDTLRSLDHWIEDAETGATDITYKGMEACLSWIYFRTCSIEQPESRVALYLSDEEWALVNEGIRFLQASL